MTRLDWEAARKRDQARVERPPRPQAADPSARWWWLPAKWASRCPGCGNPWAKGDVIAFCPSASPKTLCAACAENRKLTPGWSRHMPQEQDTPKPKRRRRRGQGGGKSRSSRPPGRSGEQRQ